MNYRRLGNSGLKLSELSFGSWVTYGAQLGDDSARECMAAAHDAGVNFFDNAEVYAISTRTGKLLHRIKVGSGPHGLCVWPQPGRYSLGHTGITR